MWKTLQVLTLIAVSVHPGFGQSPVNAGAAVDQTFLANVAEYLKLRKTALQDLPPLKPEKAPGDLLGLQRQMAERIQTARASAKQGDICSPEIAAELKRLISFAMQGREAARIRKSLRNAEPMAIPLAVNGRFPDKLPLQSTPASLLLNLPRLPSELEYRLVGRTLVLRDTANVIIDFVPDALPPNP